MKVYGIAREGWGGNNYYCDYSEDISLYFSKEKRDNEFDKLESNGEVQYSRFETEVEE